MALWGNWTLFKYYADAKKGFMHRPPPLRKWPKSYLWPRCGRSNQMQICRRTLRTRSSRKMSRFPRPEIKFQSCTVTPVPIIVVGQIWLRLEDYSRFLPKWLTYFRPVATSFTNQAIENADFSRKFGMQYAENRWSTLVKKYQLGPESSVLFLVNQSLLSLF